MDSIVELLDEIKKVYHEYYKPKGLIAYKYVFKFHNVPNLTEENYSQKKPTYKIDYRFRFGEKIFGIEFFKDADVKETFEKGLKENGVLI